MMLILVITAVFFCCQLALLKLVKKKALWWAPAGVLLAAIIFYLATANFEPRYALGPLIMGMFLFLPAAVGMLLAWLIARCIR